jgi:lauroyl/myristoyl acyltransferase
MRERLILAGYFAGWRAVRLLPEPLAYGLFTLIADVAWWRHGKGVRRLEANLARAVPGAGPDELRRLSREGMRSYLRYWCDAFRMPSWSPERILGSCRLLDEERVRPLFESGRGVVVAMAHQGNWDHAGAWSTLDLAKVTTVAERLQPEELFDQFVAYREHLGMEILPLTGSGRNVFGTLMRRVRAGGFVPLLCERDLTDQGVPVTLLGEPARMAAGPAALAIATKAPLIPLNIYYERLPRGSVARWGVVLQTHPVVPIPAGGSRAEQIQTMMQACADVIGEGIRQHPQDWHMLQRVFEADLEPRVRVRVGPVVSVSPGPTKNDLTDGD